MPNNTWAEKRGNEEIGEKIQFLSWNIVVGQGRSYYSEDTEAETKQVCRKRGRPGESQQLLT